MGRDNDDFDIVGDAFQLTVAIVVFAIILTALIAAGMFILSPGILVLLPFVQWFSLDPDSTKFWVASFLICLVIFFIIYIKSGKTVKKTVILYLILCTIIFCTYYGFNKVKNAVKTEHAKSRFESETMDMPTHTRPMGILDRDFVDFEALETMGGQYEVFFSNNFYFDVTIKVDMELENLKSSIPLPYSTTLRGKERKKCFSLILIDANKSGKYDANWHSDVGNMDAKHDNSYIYSLPYRDGTGHYVTQGFGGTVHGKSSHYAIDFKMKEGTEVYAARDGIVVGYYGKSNKSGPNDDFARYANYIFIRHKDLTIGKYLHLKQNGTLVRIGQKVKRGELIGYSGRTGFTYGAHLHFEVVKAIPGKGSMSVPVKFMTRTGVISNPIEGHVYFAKSS